VPALARDRSASLVPDRLAEGRPALAPLQHVRFCQRYPAECASNSAADQRIELSPEVMGLLMRVNRGVNHSIKPMMKDALAERWTIQPSAGDCNDYAVTKRHALLAAGLPSSALRLSVTRTSFGIGHLVLIVSSRQGDLVLDNLSEKIVPWRDTDYQWLKIQSAANPQFWSDIRLPDSRTVSLSSAEPVRVATQ
jgi:predicted transglutaminase-like cysteine proteinase